MRIFWYLVEQKKSLRSKIAGSTSTKIITVTQPYISLLLNDPNFIACQFPGIAIRDLSGLTLH
jgi:hypothetical protein